MSAHNTLQYSLNIARYQHSVVSLLSIFQFPSLCSQTNLIISAQCVGKQSRNWGSFTLWRYLATLHRGVDKNDEYCQTHFLRGTINYELTQFSISHRIQYAAQHCLFDTYFHHKQLSSNMCNYISCQLQPQIIVRSSGKYKK